VCCCALVCVGAITTESVPVQIPWSDHARQPVATTPMRSAARLHCTGTKVIAQGSLIEVLTATICVQQLTRRCGSMAVRSPTAHISAASSRCRTQYLICDIVFTSDLVNFSHSEVSSRFRLWRLYSRSPPLKHKHNVRHGHCMRHNNVTEGPLRAHMHLCVHVINNDKEI
jgi:hypothetical protein